MPVSGVAHASLATSVIPLSDLGATQPLATPTPLPTQVYAHPVAPYGHYPATAAGPAYPPQPQPPDRRRGMGWWWLPVIAALLVAGCAFLTRLENEFNGAGNIFFHGR